jgi:hypothetical protein
LSLWTVVMLPQAGNMPVNVAPSRPVTKNSELTLFSQSSGSAVAGVVGASNANNTTRTSEPALQVRKNERGWLWPGSALLLLPQYARG